MAANSKREQIIVYNKTMLESVNSIKTIKRVKQEYQELSNFAQTQFPVIALVGHLPVPEDHRENREGDRDQFDSELKIDLYVYIQQQVDQDEQISNLLDDIWAKLYTDQTRNGLVISTKLIPDDKIGNWKPFTAFKLTIVHRYIHNTGGI